MDKEFIETSELPKEISNMPVELIGGKARAIVKKLKTENIYIDPEKTPKKYKTEELAALAMDILKNGLLRPITVIESNFDFYLIISGEKRFRACLLARLEEVPCTVIYQKVSNNISIPPKNYFEKAKFYAEAVDRGLYDEKNIALKSQLTLDEVNSVLLLLSFSEEEQALLIEKGVPETIAKKLVHMDVNTRKGFLETIMHGTNVSAVCSKISEVYYEKFHDKQERVKKIKFSINGNGFLLNSIDHAVKTMRRGGVDVDYNTQETERGITLTLTIPKKYI